MNETKKVDPFHFRCMHRHNGLSHPRCYWRYLNSEIENEVKLPKILVFDIERAPLQAFVWNVWNTNVHDENIISDWYALSWSAKWLFNSEIMSESLTGRESLAENDKRIVKSLWKLLDEADIVIAHNAVGFDIPNMNTRFIVHDLTPTSPYQIIDTLKVARKQFGFTHNGLNALAKVFGFEAKLETNFELWKKCVGGDDKALKEMEVYNRHDVELLEEVYIKLRPWIKSHPNVGLYVESIEPICPNCGSSEVILTDKYYYTPTGKYQTYRCICGAYGRMRHTAVSKEVRKNLITSVAR